VIGLSTNTEINVVAGAEYNAMAKQLVHACFKKLSAGDIVELSLKSLNTEADVLKPA
jgi:hypothetical protein